MEDRQEYRWQLNDAKQIETIEAGRKARVTAPGRRVHDCNQSMRCAAAKPDASATGPFVVHSGFRKDRLDEAKDFLSRYQPDLVNTPLGHSGRL